MTGTLPDRREERGGWPIGQRGEGAAQQMTGKSLLQLFFRGRAMAMAMVTAMAIALAMATPVAKRRSSELQLATCA